MELWDRGAGQKDRAMLKGVGQRDGTEGQDSTKKCWPGGQCHSQMCRTEGQDSVQGCRTDRQSHAQRCRTEGRCCSQRGRTEETQQCPEGQCHSQRCGTEGQTDRGAEGQTDRATPGGVGQMDRAMASCTSPPVGPSPSPSLSQPRQQPHGPVPALLASGPCGPTSRQCPPRPSVRPSPPILIHHIPPARGQRAQQPWQAWPLIPGHASPGGTVAVTHSPIGDQCPRRTIRDKAGAAGG